jgi:hypothetical protein
MTLQRSNPHQSSKRLPAVMSTQDIVETLAAIDAREVEQTL